MRLLRVIAPHYVAGAEWKRKGDTWVCYRAAPILKWMLLMEPDEARRVLQRRGCKYEWVG